MSTPLPQHIPFRDNCFFHFAACNNPVAKSVLFICVSNLIFTGMGQVSKVRSIEFAQIILAFLSILEHFLRPNIRYLPIKKDNVNISISFKLKHMPFKRIKMQHHTSFQNYLIPFRHKKSARWLANRLIVQKIYRISIFLNLSHDIFVFLTILASNHRCI